MGVIKNIICGYLSQRFNPIQRLVSNNRVFRVNMERILSKSAHLPVASLTASIIFGLAAFNLSFPGLLLKWLQDVHRSGKLTLPRLLLPPIMWLCIWLPINYWMEEVLSKCLAAVYPEGLPFLHVYTLVLSLLCFFCTVVFNTSVPQKAGYYSSALARRRRHMGDPYKRTRSGAIYGRYDLNDLW